MLQVVYAYPNEYTVGITSLGYQLVGGRWMLKQAVPTRCPVHAAPIAGVTAALQPAAAGDGLRLAGSWPTRH